MFIAIAAAILSTASALPVATAPAPQPSPTAASDKTDPRVCVVDTVTGSRIRMRTCKRLTEWRADGVDPLPGR